MYKIALIDDEAIVREGMRELIPWEKIGLELIGTAEDGEMGLILIQEKLPDIILLDINMPKLNGLDLASIVSKNYPGTKIILISGYDEFDYARQALRMGVEDYILKPVTKSEMITLLKKIIGKLDKEKEQIKKEADVLNKIEQSIPLMQQKLLEELIFTEIQNNLIVKRCMKANIPYNKKYYGIFILDADEEIENKELTYFAVQNIVAELTRQKGWGILFEAEGYNAVLYFTNQEELENQSYQEIIAYIKKVITEHMGISLTIGAGGLVKDINQIHQSYKEAYQALMSRFFQGKDKIIENSQVYDYQKVQFTEWIKWDLEVVRSINQKEEFERVISSFCMEIRKNKMTIEGVQEIWIHIISSMFKKFIEIDPTIIELFPKGINISEEIKKFKTLLDMQSWINGLYEECYNYINSQAKPNKVHIKNIITFIEENYNVQDLSMKKVCENVHISPSHFSNIFKKEIGVTFVQYVTDYRMEKAKQLLNYTPLKTYEVSEAVGFSDAHYFSTTFKKATGWSPSEYRKINGEHRR